MKINDNAVRHAQQLRASRMRARAQGRAAPLRNDDDLGDFFGDLLGNIPIIGGLFGGGGDKKDSGGASGPAPGMMGMPMPMGGGGGSGNVPSLEQIRAVVQDALAGNRDIVERMQLLGTGGEQQMQKASNAIAQSILPTLQQARGGVQVQRLQTQASSEHASLTKAADRARLETSRHQELLSRLGRIQASADALQSRVAVNPMVRNILNMR
jgi:hypothetical protein